MKKFLAIIALCLSALSAQVITLNQAGITNIVVEDNSITAAGRQFFRNVSIVDSNGTYGTELYGKMDFANGKMYFWASKAARTTGDTSASILAATGLFAGGYGVPKQYNFRTKNSSHISGNLQIIPNNGLVESGNQNITLVTLNVSSGILSDSLDLFRDGTGDLNVASLITPSIQWGEGDTPVWEYTGGGSVDASGTDLSLGSVTAPTGDFDNIPASNIAPGGTEGLGFGWEYLYYLRKLWMNGVKPLIVLAGDSNMNGFGVSDLLYKPQYGLKNSIVLAGFDADIVQMAVSGSNTKDWVLNSLPAQLALNPDVLILRTLINRVVSTPDSNEYWLRRGLDSVRAHGKNVNFRTCILEMPSATADSAWFLSVEPWLRVVARDYQCVYIDTWTMWRDNAHSDSSWTPDRDHPTDVLSMAIVGQMADILAPRFISQMMGNNVFPNMQMEAGTWDINDVTPWQSLALPNGLSGYRVRLPSVAQYPIDGALLTFRQPDTALLQINFGRDNDNIAIRQGGPSGLRKWRYPLISDDTGAVANVGSGGVYYFRKALKVFGGGTFSEVDASALTISGATTLNTLHTTGNATIDGEAIVKGVSGLTVSGPEGVAGGLAIQADEGDDNADVWIHFANLDGTYALRSYSGGGHDVMTFTGSTSAATFTGNVSAPSFNTSSAAVAGTGVVTFGTLSPCASGAVTYIPHQSQGVNGYIPWCHP